MTYCTIHFHESVYTAEVYQIGDKFSYRLLEPSGLWDSPPLEIEGRATVSSPGCAAMLACKDVEVRSMVKPVPKTGPPADHYDPFVEVSA